MKLIIAGSRTIQVQPFEIHALLQHYGIDPITEIVSGTAKGIDQGGEAYAKEVGVKCTQFPADWDLHGKSAGAKRNMEMGRYADALLLIWDGSSPGSKMMKTIMENLDKPVFEAVINSKSIVPNGDYSIGSNLSEKVEYVKSQGQIRKHHCHWPDCDAEVPPAMWGCKTHWFKLPKHLRDRIWATYRPGQEINATPSRAYVTVARQVQDWIKENYK
jgi:hypothetical protein